MSLRSAVSLSAFAVVALSQGAIVTNDIALVGVNATASATVADAFNIVALRNLAIGETFNFTDNGVNADGTLRDTEQARTWTSTAAVSAGSIIAFTFVSTTTDWAANTGAVSLAAATTNNTGLSTSGDQLLFYNGTLASPSVITSYNYGNSGYLTTGSPNSNTSYLPTGFTNGVNALSVSASPNAEYTGPRTGSKSSLVSSLYNVSNWTGNATTAIGFNTTPFTIQAVPEPASFVVLGLGALAFLKRRSKA